VVALELYLNFEIIKKLSKNEKMNLQSIKSWTVTSGTLVTVANVSVTGTT